MRLPGPNSGIYWKEYEISTPTFDLSPIEKPDFSPYLIHMTGRQQLASILRGENAPDSVAVPAENGFLRACVPVYGAGVRYDCQVVCFTESPIFALDFFRYRTFRRWNQDQQFGLGFSKSNLVSVYGVRPVVYLDDNTNNKLLSLCYKAENNSINFSGDEEEDAAFKNVLATIKPLLFPLLESQQQQGYMWEREWRCITPNGMVFSLDDVRVICCPHNERPEIEEILGARATNGQIQLVETWKEYDEVTNYLIRRNNVRTLVQLDDVNDIGRLNEMLAQNEQTLHSLELYSDVFRETANRLNRADIVDILAQMRAQSQEMRSKIQRLEQEERERQEAAKQKK